MKRIKKNDEIQRWWKRRNNSLTTYHLSTEKIYHGALFTLHLLTYIDVHISDDVVEGRDGEHTIGSIRYKLCSLYALSRITSCCHFVMLMIRWNSTIDLTLRWNNSEHKTASSSSVYDNGSKISCSSHPHHNKWQLSTIQHKHKHTHRS